MKGVVIPKPHQLWTKSHQRAIFPLYLCISMVWGLEMYALLVYGKIPSLMWRGV
jgi:hypothetical protein